MSGAILLDTHVVVWLAVEPEQVPQALRRVLESADRLFVSAATTYELAQKSRLGKLPKAAGILAHWDGLLDSMMAESLPLSAQEMALAGGLKWSHRDPFDRMIAAQAQARVLRIATKDPRIQAFEDVSCVPWR